MNKYTMCVNISTLTKYKYRWQFRRLNPENHWIGLRFRVFLHASILTLHLTQGQQKSSIVSGIVSLSVSQSVSQSVRYPSHPLRMIPFASSLAPWHHPSIQSSIHPISHYHWSPIRPPDVSLPYTRRTLLYIPLRVLRHEIGPSSTAVLSPGSPLGELIQTP